MVVVRALDNFFLALAGKAVCRTVSQGFTRLQGLRFGDLRLKGVRVEDLGLAGVQAFAALPKAPQWIRKPDPESCYGKRAQPQRVRLDRLSVYIYSLSVQGMRSAFEACPISRYRCWCNL